MVGADNTEMEGYCSLFRNGRTWWVDGDIKNDFEYKAVIATMEVNRHPCKSEERAHMFL